MSSRLRFLVFLAALPVAALLSACIDSSSGSDFVREVGLNVNGLYQGANGANLVSQTSGADVTQMNIRQTGSEITGIDNNGNLYRGNINQVSGDSAGFTMKGVTSSGAEATINGAFNVSGDTSTINGRWIEPTVLASISGSSFIPGRTPDPTTNDVAIAISPAGDQTLSVDQTQQFTASGGNGSDYTWALSNGNIGSLNRTSGANVTYTASAAGDQTVTVTSSSETTSFDIDQTAAAVALSVTPAGNQSIDVPDSVGFTASGGDNAYAWSLSNGDIGTLSATTGGSVTYVGTVAGTQTVTVESGGETVTRRVNQSAANTPDPLSVSPAIANVNSGSSQVFTASGGTAPYTWSTSNNGIGSVSPTEGRSVTYSATAVGAQTLTVTDSDNNTLNVTIGQLGAGGGITPPLP